MTFHAFFVKYLAFNSDIMELLLSLASLKCFEMKQATKYKEKHIDISTIIFNT